MNDLDYIWEQALPCINTIKETSNDKVCDCENGAKIIEVNYYTMCEECGRVLDFSMISDEAEWRVFSNSEPGALNKVRCGNAANILLPVSSTSTSIYGNSKLSKMQFWSSIPYSEKVLMDLKKKLINIIYSHKLPSHIIESTLHLYSYIYNLKNEGKKVIFRGKNKIGIISVCFYYACNNVQCNISSTLICKMFDIDKKIFSKCYKIYTELNCKTLNHKNYKPEDFIIIIVNKLQLSFKVQKIISIITNVVTAMQLFSKSTPQTIISSIVYFTISELDLKMSVLQVAKVSDTSTSVIIKNYKIINSCKNYIFNNIKDSLTA